MKVPMAYYKLLIHAWFSWDPSESDLEEISRRSAVRDGVLCTAREVVAAVGRPQDIEDKEAIRFFGGEEEGAELSQG